MVPGGRRESTTVFSACFREAGESCLLTLEVGVGYLSDTVAVSGNGPVDSSEALKISSPTLPPTTLPLRDLLLLA